MPTQVLEQLSEAQEGALHEVVYEGRTPQPNGPELRSANEFIPWDHRRSLQLSLNLPEHLNSPYSPRELAQILLRIIYM
jgi:hypothetical protein